MEDKAIVIDALCKKEGFLVRYGISLIFTLSCCLFVGMFFIPYYEGMPASHFVITRLVYNPKSNETSVYLMARSKLISSSEIRAKVQTFDRSTSALFEGHIVQIDDASLGNNGDNTKIEIVFSKKISNIDNLSIERGSIGNYIISLLFG
jgi:lipoprotein